MRLATLVTVIVALALAAVASAAATGWTPAVDPHLRARGDAQGRLPVQHPADAQRPRRDRLARRRTAVRRRARGRTTLDVASLHSDDTLSLPRALGAAAALARPARDRDDDEGPDRRRVRRGGDGAALGEVDAGDDVRAAEPLGGPAALVATANGYIGDADVVTTADHGGTR